MSPVEQRLRQVIWGAALAILVGTPAELVLTEHWGDPPQWIPFGLSAVGLLAIGAAWLRPSPGTLKALRWAMAVLAMGGIFGMWEHVEHNYAFAAEIGPTKAVTAWMIEAVWGANPLLAPGIYVVAAGLGWGGSLSHPAEPPTE